MRRFILRWWTLYTTPPGMFIDVDMNSQRCTFTLWYRLNGPHRERWGPFESSQEMWNMFLVATKDVLDRAAT